MAAERRWHAMGSDAHVIVVGGPVHLIDDAVLRVDALEERWSRFLPDSEVSQLNRWAGIPVAVSPDTVALVHHAIVAWRLSGGAFDPTVLGDVIRAGYDRSFEQIGRARPAADSALGRGADSIVVATETVTLPAGTGFDPGGIGKGLAADLVCAEMMHAGALGICVNLGGDVRVAGTGPDGGCWTVAVEQPGAAHPVANLGLVDGAVATSTTLRRRWQVNGEHRHHLIDPADGPTLRQRPGHGDRCRRPGVDRRGAGQGSPLGRISSPVRRRRWDRRPGTHDRGGRPSPRYDRPGGLPGRCCPARIRTVRLFALLAGLVQVDTFGQVVRPSIARMRSTFMPGPDNPSGAIAMSNDLNSAIRSSRRVGSSTAWRGVSPASAGMLMSTHLRS
jgi:FAD:protein FMN transferase